MEQVENYITIAGFIAILIFWAIIATIYIRSWNELKKAFTEDGIKGPFYSQKEINETFKADLMKGYKITGEGMGQAFKILFFMRTDNPAISKPLRRVRRALLTFFLLPILVVFILVTIYVFRAV